MRIFTIFFILILCYFLISTNAELDENLNYNSSDTDSHNTGNDINEDNDNQQNSQRNDTKSSTYTNRSDTSSSDNNNSTEQSIKNSSSSMAEESAALWEKNQRLQAQQEARKKRKMKEREKEHLTDAQRTLEAAKDESCDWKQQPLAALKGEVCGSYYKVLGINRRSGLIDKSAIKKAYRQKSLSVHPDKNSSPEANEAFKLVQDAYECLTDDSCKSNYDIQLQDEEMQISLFREQLKHQVIEKTFKTLTHAHYYVSVAAHHIFQTGMDIWDLIGEIEWNLFGHPRPIGQFFMILGLLWKGKWVLILHALSYAVVRINYELAKSRGLL